MIALSPRVYKLWRKGPFAFKCLGVILGEPATIRLQFRWMPADLRKPRRHIDLDTDNQDVLEDLVRYSQVSDTANAGVFLEESESSRQALSGDIFDIRMPYFAKTSKMKMIIDLQSALILTQTLSGTADFP